MVLQGSGQQIKKEAREVWKKALEIQGPVLIDFVVSQEENVYPMVVPGSTIDEMIMGTKDEKADDICTCEQSSGRSTESCGIIRASRL